MSSIFLIKGRVGNQSPIYLAMLLASLCFEYIDLRKVALTLASASSRDLRLCRISRFDLNCCCGWCFLTIAWRAACFAIFSFYLAMGFSGRRNNFFWFTSVAFFIRSRTI